MRTHDIISIRSERYFCIHEMPSCKGVAFVEVDLRVHVTNHPEPMETYLCTEWDENVSLSLPVETWKDIKAKGGWGDDLA